MAYARRTDSNHATIREVFRRLGCEVCDASRLGDGAPDLIVSFRKRLFFVEVKTARGRLTKAQEGFHARFPVSIVRNVDDALALIGGRK